MMASMNPQNTQFAVMIAGFVVVISFLWSISNDIAELREQMASNTAVTSANSDAVRANSSKIAGHGEGIANLNGTTQAHIYGHSHPAKVVSESDEAK